MIVSVARTLLEPFTIEITSMFLCIDLLIIFFTTFNCVLPPSIKIRSGLVSESS